MVDTLDPCFDDDINNDVSSLYVEIIDKNRARMHDLWPKVVEERKNWNPLELCSRQRWETTQANHIRKYKRYLDDHSVPVPKSTRLDHNKRSATRSNTASHLDSSVGLSTKLAVVLTESIASHNGETFARETEATICHYNGAFKDISCQEQVFSLRVFHNIRFSSHFFCYIWKHTNISIIKIWWNPPF